MPASVPDEDAARRRSVARNAWRRRQPARRDSVAEQIVRDADPATRALMREIALGFLDADDPGALERPEMGLVALIDRVSAEESPGGSRQGAAAGQREG